MPVSPIVSKCTFGYFEGMARGRLFGANAVGALVASPPVEGSLNEALLRPIAELVIHE